MLILFIFIFLAVFITVIGVAISLGTKPNITTDPPISKEKIQEEINELIKYVGGKITVIIYEKKWVITDITKNEFNYDTLYNLKQDLLINKENYKQVYELELENIQIKDFKEQIKLLNKEMENYEEKFIFLSQNINDESNKEMEVIKSLIAITNNKIQRIRDELNPLIQKQEDFKKEIKELEKEQENRDFITNENKKGRKSAARRTVGFLAGLAFLDWLN